MIRSMLYTFLGVNDERVQNYSLETINQADHSCLIKNSETQLNFIIFSIALIKCALHNFLWLFTLSICYDDIVVLDEVVVNSIKTLYTNRNFCGN